MEENNKIWICYMDSERFSWQSFGRTKEEAQAALIKRWIELTNRFNDITTFEELDEKYDVMTREIELGKAYRDDDL